MSDTVRKTYVTRMPDKAGAFLVAARIITEAGGNIVRVNYNKAVDLHTLFIEVTADMARHEIIAARLRECGYLPEELPDERILMIVLRLPDVPGAVAPALEVISRHKVNISYISAQADGSPWQDFKMGLLIENTGEMSRLVEELSDICELRILDYEVTDRLLDGTVFYITFANEMRQILSLTQEQTRKVLIYSNRIMQLLDEQKKSPIQTFDYIRRFARFVRDRQGDEFKAELTELRPAEGLTVRVISPPCGSNVCVLEYGGELLFVDTGFACYREEMLALLRRLWPDFDAMPRQAFLTHADVDHAGLLDLFGQVYMSADCALNFALERAAQPNFREQNPMHSPYARLSRVISRYAPPPEEICLSVGEKTDGELFTLIGSRPFGKWRFDFWQGCGGHVRGETVIVCEELRLLFSGDIYVNIRGFTDEQREFNALAPFLMTGVETDSALCKRSREELLRRYPGYLILPGHGAPLVNPEETE